MVQMLAFGVRLLSGETLLHAKNSTGHRRDSNPGPCRQHNHCCKRAKPLRHLDPFFILHCFPNQIYFIFLGIFFCKNRLCLSSQTWLTLDDITLNNSLIFTPTAVFYSVFSPQSHFFIFSFANFLYKLCLPFQSNVVKVGPPFYWVMSFGS